MSSSNQPTVLVVDDVPENIQIAAEILKANYNVLAANSGSAALKTAQKQQLDAVVLDVMMPGMDGFEVCRQLKDDIANARVPIIFLTALDAPADIQKGLDLGAFYYLTKPVNPEQLKAVVATATENFGVYQTLREESSQIIKSFSLISEGEFRFQTLAEARNLAILVAKACPNPDKSLLGLSELMINAVEHGNLGITYDEKSTLNSDGLWAEEVERRLTLPEYASKFASLHLERSPHETRVTIRDQGAGFDWESYLQMAPERAMDNHGRGIAMANAFSFENLEYRGNGNEVTAKITDS